MIPPDPGAVRLESLPWPAIQALIESGHELLLLPLGATEQHGPHLPINTDTVIATALCDHASARTGVPILPALPITVSLGHTEKWPGTFSLFHETFIAALREIAAWAIATGWRRLLFVNAHFGNDAALRVAVDRLRFDHPDTLYVGTCNTFRLNDDVWRAFTSDAADLHANQAETDLMLHLAPHTVRMDQAQDDPDRTAGLVFPHLVAHTSRNGVTGAPSLGSPERGRHLFALMTDALVALVEQARRETRPLPWSRPRPFPTS